MPGRQENLRIEVGEAQGLHGSRISDVGPVLAVTHDDRDAGGAVRRLDHIARIHAARLETSAHQLPEGVAAQTEQSLKNIRALLSAAGADIENVVKTTVFITNMADFPLVNAEYSKVFAENPPARSCVAVKDLPLGGLVEIEVLAVV